MRRHATYVQPQFGTTAISIADALVWSYGNSDEAQDQDIVVTRLG